MIYLNFLVGVVIVDFNGWIVGVGGIELVGGDYVEVVVLCWVGGLVIGVIVVVIMEFCNYYGKILLCVNVLIEVRVGMVVYVVVDLNGIVGGGVGWLLVVGL